MSGHQARVLSVHRTDFEWLQLGDFGFNAMFFGPRLDANSPVAVILRGTRDAGDRIAGSRVHDTPSLITIVEGSVQLDGQWFARGQIQVVPAGALHGDLVFGPEGATLMILYAKRAGMIPRFEDADDQTRFDEAFRADVEGVASGAVEKPVVLLPPRPSFTPRRGIKVLDPDEADRLRALSTR